jgi:hypothetical protein
METQFQKRISLDKFIRKMEIVSLISLGYFVSINLVALMQKNIDQCDHIT